MGVTELEAIIWPLGASPSQTGTGSGRGQPMATYGAQSGISGPYER